MGAATDEVLEQLATATGRVVDALAGADLAAPSELPGWSRLTIACHLRYGAEALLAMTVDALAGRAASYYPQGRDGQRPATLLPRPGESPASVVSSLRAASATLHDRWSSPGINWSTAVREPPDNPDLGTVPLAWLPIFRLTEVEVHGTDLGLGLPPWSDVLVRHALPMRLARLAARRDDGAPPFVLAAPDLGIDARVGVGDGGAEVRRIVAPGRDLLGLLLGRWDDGSDAVAGFRRVHPGP